MDFLKCSDQHVNMMLEASNKARDPCVFKTINLCIVVGCIRKGEGQ